MRVPVSSSAAQIEQLHGVPAVASAIGRHPISVYKAIGGLLDMPIPKFVRMGRSIRFRDGDVKAFLAGLTSQGDQAAVATSVALAPARGRPRKSRQEGAA